MSPCLARFFSLFELWRSCEDKNRFEEIMPSALSNDCGKGMTNPLTNGFRFSVRMLLCSALLPFFLAPEFEISAAGALAALEAQVRTNPGSQSARALRRGASANAHLTLHSPARLDSPTQPPRLPAPLLALLALTGGLFAVCIFLAWHASRNDKARTLLGKWPAPSGQNVRH